MTRRIRASAIILKNNQVLLIKRLHSGDHYWVFPGGGVEEGEDRFTAAIREVKEETSLDVTNIISQYTYPDPHSATTKHFLIACEVSEGEPVLGGPEAAEQSDMERYEPVWVNISDALSYKNLYPIPVKNFLRDLNHASKS